MIGLCGVIDVVTIVVPFGREGSGMGGGGPVGSASCPASRPVGSANCPVGSATELAGIACEQKEMVAVLLVNAGPRIGVVLFSIFFSADLKKSM